LNSRWVGLGAGVVAVLAGTIGAIADRPWLGLVAAVGGAVAGLIALLGPPLPAEMGMREPAAFSPFTAATARMSTTLNRDGGRERDADIIGFIDPETKLFNEAFFSVAVSTRVSSARRHLRPVSIVLVEVARSHHDQRAVPVTLVASAVERTIRDSDTACRLSGDRIGLVLEDTAEDGAVVLLDRLRVQLAGVVPEAVCWAGIACYPTHVFHAGEAQAKAARALTVARAWPQHRVEVATAE